MRVGGAQYKMVPQSFYTMISHGHGAASGGPASEPHFATAHPPSLELIDQTAVIPGLPGISDATDIMWRRWWMPVGGLVVASTFLGCEV